MAAGTEQRIRAVIDQLGYTRNTVARGLRSARTRALAFLVTDASARFLADPMTDLFLAGLGDDLRDRDHGLLIQSAHPNAPFESLLAPVAEGRVDGAVLFLSGAQSCAAAASSACSSSGCRRSCCRSTACRRTSTRR